MRVPIVLTGVLLAAAAAAAPAPKGHLVLVGGGSKPPEAMATFVAVSGGRDASIVVFPTASEDPQTGPDLEKLFRGELGCSNVAVLAVKTREDAARPEFVRAVASAGGIFFSGGDQRRITAALLDTPLGAAVAAAFARGAAVGGTSAGTACQSALMITGEGDFTVIAADTVELKPGLGLFPGVIVDQHFVARQRQNRLIAVVLEHPDLLGVGVDEATAVWVRPDRTFQVLGKGWVTVFDAARATVARRPGEKGRTHLGVHGLVTHVLLPGETFDLAARAPVAGK